MSIIRQTNVKINEKIMNFIQRFLCYLAPKPIVPQRPKSFFWVDKLRKSRKKQFIIWLTIIIFKLKTIFIISRPRITIGTPTVHASSFYLKSWEFLAKPLHKIFNLKTNVRQKVPQMLKHKFHNWVNLKENLWWIKSYQETKVIV
jgi:hypothetical protein